MRHKTIDVHATMLAPGKRLYLTWLAAYKRGTDVAAPGTLLKRLYQIDITDAEKPVRTRWKSQQRTCRTG
jgi:hypothetical protein